MLPILGDEAVPGLESGVMAGGTPVASGLEQTGDPSFAAINYEVFRHDGAAITSLASVRIDSSGSASANIDWDQRTLPSQLDYFVDAFATMAGDGLTPTSPLADLPSALRAASLSGADGVTLHLAPGQYQWGDFGHVGTSLTVLGAGVGQTIVTPGQLDRYAAKVRRDSLFVRGVTFRGGQSALDVRGSASVTIIDSEVTGATLNDGLNLANVTSVLVVGTRAHGNAADGMSYTNPNRQPMEILEVDVDASGNGLNGQWNSQGSTIHGSVSIVRVGGVYANNPTNISDVSSGESWNIGIQTAGATVAMQRFEYLNFNVSGGGTAYLIGGDHSGQIASPTVINANPEATIYYPANPPAGIATLATVPSMLRGNVVPRAILFTALEVPADPEFPPRPPVHTVVVDATDLGRGLAVDDLAAGDGFLMYSGVPVTTRFAETDWIDGVSASFLVVRLHGDQWQFNDNIHWIDFDSHPQDRLIAAIDFGTDRVESLVGQNGMLGGMTLGYLSGDLEIVANQWNGRFNRGEFEVNGTHFAVQADGPINSQLPGGASSPGESTIERVELVNLGSGLAIADRATGLGYLMHSSASILERLAGHPLNASSSVHFMMVRHEAGQWQFNDNLSWIDFTPAAADRLIAAVDFDADSVDLLVGRSGSVGGIDLGYVASDIEVFANQWNGRLNFGEFEIAGSYFEFSRPG